MVDRLTIHERLCKVLGSNHVYFQPPSSVQLRYPCILYSLHRYEFAPADNTRYLEHVAYDLIVIDKNPDSKIPMNLIKEFRTCSFDRAYQSNNLNHFALSLTI